MPDVRRLLGLWKTTPTRHNLLEDAQGLLTGSMISALGFYLLGSIGLLTGGTAGVAFLLHYATGISFGIFFFVLNLPFYILSIRRVGWDFTIKTFAAIAITSFLTDIESRFLTIGYLNPVWGAVLGGVLIGFGLLALYRHRASLGGIGILAVYIQDRFGIRAGLVQMGFDVMVLIAAIWVVEPSILACSVIGAVVINLFLTINHRSDRYIALR